MVERHLMNGLTFYRHVIDHEVVKAWQDLMNVLDSGDPAKVISTYHTFVPLAMEHRWPDTLIELILDDDNLFSRTIAKGTEVSPYLKEIAKRDLVLLQEVLNTTAQSIKDKVIQGFEQNEEAWNITRDHPLHPYNWPEWEQENPKLSSFSEKRKEYSEAHSFAAQYLIDARQKIKETLQEKPLAVGIGALVNHYKEIGFGIFGHYAAVRWHRENSQGILKGVENPDPIQLGDLVGLEREKNIVSENTEHFLAGLPSNNVLLYGNRGTGKSSMVKALLNSYVKKGLRLVEVAKNDLQDFSNICKRLEKEPFKFILFIDDLSFDDHEPEYKALKTLIEGGIQARPDNILVYATSNRKHLIKETHEERQSEVHGRDVQEEKLSLSDRFGITVTFSPIDQVEYLEIVESLAAQRGLSINTEDLRQLALRWELMQNGRSGRTARQLIDKLIAQEKFDSSLFNID